MPQLKIFFKSLSAIQLGHRRATSRLIQNRFQFGEVFQSHRQLDQAVGDAMRGKRGEEPAATAVDGKRRNLMLEPVGRPNRNARGGFF
jgi:hypothetical protein